MLQNAERQTTESKGDVMSFSLRRDLSSLSPPVPPSSRGLVLTRRRSHRPPRLPTGRGPLRRSAFGAPDLGDAGRSAARHHGQSGGPVATLARGGATVGLLGASDGFRALGEDGLPFGRSVWRLGVA